MFKKKWFLLLMVSVMMMVVAACGSKTETASEPAKTNNGDTSKVPDTVPENMVELYQAALKEGELTFWSATEEAHVQGYAKRFNEMYPGIKINHFVIQPGEAAQRYITEQSSGNVSVDIMDGSQRFYPALLERDLVQKFNYKDYGVETTFYDDRLISHYHLTYPLAYNTNLVKKDELPKTWEELIDPKWKGKIGVETRVGTLALLAQKWGDEKTLNYLDQILELDPVILKGGIPTANSVASGEVAFAIGTYGFQIELLKKQGAPIDWVKTESIPVYNYLSGVLKDAPHPNAAFLFNIWMNSAEGVKAQEEFKGVGMVTNTENLSKLGKAWKKAGIEIIIDKEENLEQITKITEELTGKVNSLQ